jgi:hypothetical protein
MFGRFPSAPTATTATIAPTIKKQKIRFISLQRPHHPHPSNKPKGKHHRFHAPLSEVRSTKEILLRASRRSDV